MTSISVESVTTPSVSTAFVPPFIHVGASVRWIPPGRIGQKFFPAIVLRKNADETLFLATLTATEEGQTGRVSFENLSCMHKDDPRIYTDGRKRYGYWELSNFDKALRKLLPELVDVLKDFD